MDDRWAYLSIIKGLPAEYGALADLTPDIRVTPLVQLWDKHPAADPDDAAEDQVRDQEWSALTSHPQQAIWETGTADKLWSRLRRGLLERRGSRWSTDRQILLDGEWLNDAAVYEVVLDNIRAAGWQSVPVTGILRDPAYQVVVANTAAHDGRGAVLRLRRADLAVGADDLARGVRRLLAEMALRPESVDLLIDLGVAPLAYRERDEITVEQLLRSLPYIDEWRNLAVAASGMPRNGGEFPRSEIKPFPRSEWWLWRELLTRSKKFARTPVFADYGVIHPERVEAIGEAKGKRARIPWLLYSVNDSCLSIRAEDLGRDGTVDDLRRLLIRLRDEGDWCGPTFSKGDEWVAAIIDGSSEAGGWQRWRRVGLGHHWTYLSRQLSNLSAA